MEHAIWWNTVRHKSLTISSALFQCCVCSLYTVCLGRVLCFFGPNWQTSIDMKVNIILSCPSMTVADQRGEHYYPLNSSAICAQVHVHNLARKTVMTTNIICIWSQEDCLKAQRSKDKAEKEKDPSATNSPFACISASMSWDTFQLVQSIWLEAQGVQSNREEKDWKVQVRKLLSSWK